MRVPRKSSRIIPIAFSFWISAEGHSASLLCAAVLLLDSDGQAARKGDQCPHGRDGHAPFFWFTSNFKGTMVSMPLFLKIGRDPPSGTPA